MFRLSQPKDNAVIALHALVKTLGAKVTAQTVEETVKSHPDYPSMLALSDALLEWQIDNVAVALQPEQLTEAPTPFVAYVATEGGQFTVVKSVDNESVTYLQPQQGWQQEKRTDFVQKWNGTALLAETNSQSGEANYATKRKSEILQTLRLPFILAGSFTMLGISLWLSVSVAEPVTWNWYALLIIKLMGIGISALLLWHSVDSGNALVKQLCQLNKKTNCDSILRAKAATLGGWVSWSEIGFTYFTGSFLLLLLSFGNPATQTLLVALTSLAIPYTFFSIYYQAYVARQWCTLCLTVQALLWMELLIGWNGVESFSLSLSVYNLSLVVLSFLLPVVGWVSIKPIVLKAAKTGALKNDLKRFTGNTQLFQQLLFQQPEIPPVVSNMGTITMGNPAADNVLTMVTNPYCKPCATRHGEITKLLEGNPSVKYQIIFAATNDEKDIRGEFMRHLFSLPIEKRSPALDAWYAMEEKSLNKWSKQFGTTDDETTKPTVELHQSWCDLAAVSVTPTLYWNGYKLPEVYQIKDLKHFTHITLSDYTAIEQN